MRKAAFIAVCVLVVALFALCGCASTAIKLPDGSTYESSKDVALSDVEFESFHENGQPKARLRIGNGAGAASAVNSAAWRAVNRAIDKIQVPGVTGAATAPSEGEGER